MSEVILNVTDEFLESYGFQIRGKIVRCRDCKNAWNDNRGKLRCTGYLVELWDYYNDEPSDGEIVPPDGFCAWGERKM